MGKAKGFKIRLSKSSKGNTTFSATRDMRAWANGLLGAPSDDSPLYVRLLYHPNLKTMEVRHRSTKAHGFQLVNFGGRPTATAGWGNVSHLRRVPIFKGLDWRKPPAGYRQEGEELIYCLPLEAVSGDSTRQSPQPKETAVPSEPVAAPTGDSPAISMIKELNPSVEEAVLMMAHLINLRKGS
jgi:hypothetical protein